MSDDDFLRVEVHDCPMSSCAAPAGSPCRTSKHRVAVQYHTARFRLVPSLAKALTVATPPLRKPGSAWVELPRPAVVDAEPAGHVRIGYARASTMRQSLDTQLDSLARAGVGRVFSEKISTRALRRPELDKAVALALEIRTSGVAVTLIVHEHKRLGRGIELATLAEQLRAAGIGLEFLTGELLQGQHDPSGVVFTVLAALAGSEREYIRDRTLEGHEAARARGKSIGGAAVTDAAMLSHALHLRDQQHLSLRDIAARLVIATGKKKGHHPSPATVLRMLRDHDEHEGPDTAFVDTALLAADAEQLPGQTAIVLPRSANPIGASAADTSTAGTAPTSAGSTVATTTGTSDELPHRPVRAWITPEAQAGAPRPVAPSVAPPTELLVAARVGDKPRQVHIPAGFSPAGRGGTQVRAWCRCGHSTRPRPDEENAAATLAAGHGFDDVVCQLCGRDRAEIGLPNSHDWEHLQVLVDPVTGDELLVCRGDADVQRACWERSAATQVHLDRAALGDATPPPTLRLVPQPNA